MAYNDWYAIKQKQNKLKKIILFDFRILIMFIITP